jgi:tmRNA-binding protein
MLPLYPKRYKLLNVFEAGINLKGLEVKIE